MGIFLLGSTMRLAWATVAPAIRPRGCNRQPRTGQFDLVAVTDNRGPGDSTGTGGISGCRKCCKEEMWRILAARSGNG